MYGCFKSGYEKAIMKDKPKIVSDAIIINEIKLILAEKRTSLSSVRTGIAVSAVQQCGCRDGRFIQPVAVWCHVLF